MSRRDRDRLKVLHEVQKRHISQKQAAMELGLSTRWVRKLLERLKQQGDGGLVHGLRGRRSNRKLPEAKRKKVLGIFERQVQRRQWHDYGPTLAAEELAADHKIQISKETLRKWDAFDNGLHDVLCGHVLSWISGRFVYGNREDATTAFEAHREDCQAHS